MRNLVLAATIFALAGCATSPGQSQYKWSEVGQSTLVEFGTIIQAREVGITGQTSGAGAAVGAAAGVAAGSQVGNGAGNAAAMVGAAVIGAVAANAIEQAAANTTGIEYVVTTEKGRTMTIVQNMNKGDVLLNAGQRVMVQTSGSYQRVLPADSLPTEIRRPQGIRVVD